MVTWDFFLFISSQQLYIFITLIKLSVAPPTSHMVWKIDFYQTYFISAVANVDYEYWFHQLMTSSLNASQCLAPLHNRLVWRSIFSFIKETKYPSHLRINITNFVSEALIQHWNLENPRVYKISDMEATIYFTIVASWSLNLFVYMLVYYISKQWWPKSWCKIPLYSRHEKIINSTQTK